MRTTWLEGSEAGELRPARALAHPLWLGAVGLLALNDHVLKGSGLLPGWLTGKLSDAAGLFAAPALLAVLLRVRTARGLLLCHLVTGAVFGAIKVSPWASSLFTAALGWVGVPWRNWCDPSDLLALPALALAYLTLPSSAALPRRRGLVEALAVLVGLPAMVASGNAGGANEGGKAPGSGDKGVNLALGDIAVDPEGRFFVSNKGGAVVVGDLTTRRVQRIEGLPSADVLAFWGGGHAGVFLLSGASDDKASTSDVMRGQQLVSYDIEERKIVWQKTIAPRSGGLYDEHVAMRADDEGQRLLIWSSQRVQVLKAATGEQVGEFAPDEGVLDVDLARSGDRVLVTGNTRNEAEPLKTTIYARALGDLSARCQVEALNCADDLVLMPQGSRAFLAPTFCSRDPVTVIDVDHCKVEAQLPGFGPVALSQNARTAVAFIDRDSTDPQAPPLPDEVKKSADRYHLMFIDTAKLTYGTTPVGADLPRYAVTPDGQLLLVDAYAGESKSVRLVDIESRSIRTVKGPPMLLETYVLMPDSRSVFAVYQGLLHIDLPAAEATYVPVPFSPRSLNLVPGGAQLLIKDTTEVVHLLDPETRKEIGKFSSEAPFEVKRLARMIHEPQAEEPVG